MNDIRVRGAVDRVTSGITNNRRRLSITGQPLLLDGQLGVAGITLIVMIAASLLGIEVGRTVVSRIGNPITIGIRIQWGLARITNPQVSRRYLPGQDWEL